MIKINTLGDKLMSIGQKIKEFRQSQNLKQSDLAKMINVSQDKISFYENDVKVPTIKTLVKIAKALNVSIDVLLDNQIDTKVEQEIIDRELLNLFKMIQNTKDEDKLVVKTLLKSFILSNQIKSLQNIAC